MAFAKLELGADTIAVADQALVSGASFVSTIVIARSVGIEAFGIYAVFTACVSLCLSIQTSGLFGPLMTSTVQPGDPDYQRFVGVGLLRALCSAVATVLGVAAVMTFWVDRPGSVWPYAFAAGAWLFQDFGRRLCFALQKERVALFSDLASYGLQVVALSLMFVSGRLDVALSAKVIGMSSVIGALVVLPLWFSSVIDREYFLSRLNAEMSEGLFLVGAAWTQWLTTSGIIIVGSVLWGPSIAGAMRASQNLMGLCHLWFQGLENVVPAEASRLRRVSSEHLVRYLKQISIRWGTLTILATVLISINHDLIFTFIYGDSFGAMGRILVVYALYYTVAFFGIPAGAGLRACGRSVELLRFSAIGATCAACWVAVAALNSPELAIAGIVLAKCVATLGMGIRLSEALRSLPAPSVT